MATENVAGVEKFAPAAASLAVRNDAPSSTFGHVPESQKQASGTYAEIEPDDVPENMNTSVPDDVPEDSDGRWRIESKGSGKFCLRCGSHARRMTIRGYYLDIGDLTDRRRSEYYDNKERDEARKRRLR